MKKSFSQLDKNFQLLLATLPMSVSDTKNPDDETDEQLMLNRDRFLSLPNSMKEKLSSIETSQKIQSIGRQYSFELLNLANITRLIREYYFGEIRLEDFPKEIEKRMGVSLFTAQEIAKYIKTEIIDWDPWGEYVSKLPKMTVREITRNHPKLADTEITSGYISLPDSEDLLDPTIQNWIHDYVLHIGQAGHSAMDRMHYLFYSENGKGLSSTDREKLGTILKSFDENTPLPIDEENGEIIFEESETEKARVQKGPAFGQQLQYQKKEQLVPPVNNSLSSENVPFNKGRETTLPPFAQGPLRSSKSETRELRRDFTKEPILQASQNNFVIPRKIEQNKPLAPKIKQSFIPQLSKPIVATQSAPAQQISFSKPFPEMKKPAVPAAKPKTPAALKNKVVSSEPKSNFRKDKPRYQPVTKRNQPTDKFFQVENDFSLPSLKIHGFTDHSQTVSVPSAPPKPIASAPKTQFPRQEQPTVKIDEPVSPTRLNSEEQVVKQPFHPRHKIIRPFQTIPTEPRIEGNIVDLREK